MVWGQWYRWSEGADKGPWSSPGQRQGSGRSSHGLSLHLVSVSHANVWVYLSSTHGLWVSGDVVGNTGCGQPGTFLWVLWVLWLWERPVFFLGFSVLLCKMNIIIVLASKESVRIQDKRVGTRPGTRWVLHPGQRILAVVGPWNTSMQMPVGHPTCCWDPARVLSWPLPCFLSQRHGDPESL